MKDSMTGRERLTKTFKGEKVDRISVSPFLWANNVYEMFKYTPTIDKNLYPDDFDFSQKYVEYADHFGFDVLFSMGLLWENFLPPSAENWEVTVEKEGDIDIKMYPVDKKYICIIISDSGCGMTEDTMKSIFDPFFTAKPKGTGLGLSIVQRIITSYNGLIDVQSVPEKGTTFTVRLCRESKPIS